MQTAHKTLLQKQNFICLKLIQPAGWVLTQCPSRRTEPQEQVTGRPNRALLFFMLSPAGHSLFLRTAWQCQPVICHLEEPHENEGTHSACLREKPLSHPHSLLSPLFSLVTNKALQLNSLTAPEIKQVTPDFLPLSWFVGCKPVPWPWQRTWDILAEFSLFGQALTPGLPSEECHCALRV